MLRARVAGRFWASDPLRQAAAECPSARPADPFALPVRSSTGLDPSIRPPRPARRRRSCLDCRSSPLISTLNRTTTPAPTVPAGSQMPLWGRLTASRRGESGFSGALGGLMTCRGASCAVLGARRWPPGEESPPPELAPSTHAEHDDTLPLDADGRPPRPCRRMPAKGVDAQLNRRSRDGRQSSGAVLAAGRARRPMKSGIYAASSTEFRNRLTPCPRTCARVAWDARPRSDRGLGAVAQAVGSARPAVRSASPGWIRAADADPGSASATACSPRGASGHRACAPSCATRPRGGRSRGRVAGPGRGAGRGRRGWRLGWRARVLAGCVSVRS